MDREEVVRHAKKIVASATIPAGCRVVVALTDENGGWVGVASNTSNHDVETILVSALEGAERIDHSPRESEPTPGQKRAHARIERTTVSTATQILEELTSEIETLLTRLAETAVAEVLAENQYAHHDGPYRAYGEAKHARRTAALALAAAIAQGGPKTPAAGQATTNTRLLCHAGRDGECHWRRCPQLRDNEPNATGRHCPLDKEDEEES